MALPVAQKIVERARKGDTTITTKERRHAIAYLLVTDVMTNQQMGELFGVSERTIRVDKRHIREEKKEQLREDDLALVVVDLQMNIERQIRDLENSKKKCKEGTAEFRNHCMAIAKIQMELNKCLQDLGWLPKNLGNMTITNYEFKAEVSQGMATAKRVEPSRDEVIDAEIIQPDNSAFQKLLNGAKNKEPDSGCEPEGTYSDGQDSTSPASNAETSTAAPETI